MIYALFAKRALNAWRTTEASMSGKTRTKAESTEEHDRRLAGYAEMEQKEEDEIRYEALLMNEQ